MRVLSVFMGVLFVLVIGIMPASAITWGEEDGNGHPNVGLISIAYLDNPSEQYPLCSGTLIHPRVLLTAGHCTNFLEALMDKVLLTIDGVKVSFNPDDALHNELLSVEEVMTHPDYNFGPYSNPRDVGALILEEPVGSITPAILPSEGFLDDLRAAGMLRQGSRGAKFIVVGYGTTLQWPPPMILDSDGKRRVAESEYQTLLKAWLRMSQNQAKGDSGTCYGDSGGPAFWKTDMTEILVGITSWGDAVCVATGFNYRVDIQDTLGFIGVVFENVTD